MPGMKPPISEFLGKWVKIKEGDVVSGSLGAAGAVGSIVGQNRQD